MKILSSSQIRKADQFTIENEPISSIKLMERAAKNFSDWFNRYYPSKGRVHIFCGTGNNGGDGMAISRMLAAEGWEVITYIINPEARMSNDFKMNYLSLKEMYNVIKISSKDGLDIEFKTGDKIIDALFGSGLTRKITGVYGHTIQAINQSGCEVISVDIPSGLYADKSSTSKHIVQSDHTVSFQLPKLAFFMPENGEYIKEFHTVNIGLHQEFLDKEQTDNYYLEKNFIKSLFKKRSRHSYKNQFGHSLIISGSYGKMGACTLAAKACLRMGSGLLTVHVPKSGYEIMQVAIPEAMVSVDSATRFIQDVPDLSNFNAIGIGPGLGTNIYTADTIAQLFKSYHNPIVIDADAINLISQHEDLKNSIPENSILTPHPGEFKRLAGDWVNDFDRLAKQQEWSKSHKVIIVLKGSYTSVSLPDGRVFFNSTGNPGMATAGSGDVLTGMITSLLAQGFSSENAALSAVFIHGLAGDIAMEKLSETSLIAGDIIDHISEAVNHIIQ